MRLGPSLSCFILHRLKYVGVAVLLSYLSVSVWGYETLAVYNILLYLVLIPPLGKGFRVLGLG